MESETSTVFGPRYFILTRAYTEWLPTSCYDLVEGFEFEKYYKKDEKYFEEVWIRVSQKK